MTSSTTETWGDKYRDVESSSTTSEDAGLLSGTKTPESPVRTTRLRYLRIFIELVLTATLVALFATNSVKFPERNSAVKRYGPIRKWRKQFNKWFQYLITSLVPRKDVIFGNTAGFGPDLVYNSHEMLWNATELKHIHRNWQQLFPSTLYSQIPSSESNADYVIEGRGYVKVRGHEEFEVLHPPFV
jgi:hypothetical protein